MLTKLSVLAAAGSASVASLLSNDSLLRVHAEAANKTPPSKSEPTNKAAGNKSSAGKPSIRACELPIYGDPDPVQFELVPVKPSAYFIAVSDARKWVWTYKHSIQGGVDKVTHAYDFTKKTTKDALQYIQRDSAALPRAIVISVAGLGGIVAGYRGGFLRKTLYASVAMATASAVCYPAQAVDISHRGWAAARDIATATYRSNVSPQSKESKPAATAASGKAPQSSDGKAPQSSDKSAGDKVTPKPPQEKKASGSTAPASSSTAPASGSTAPPKGSTGPKKDFGQSNPDDKDLYTTRGGGGK